MKPLLVTLKQHPVKVLLLLLLVGVIIYSYTRWSKVQIVNVVNQLPKHPSKTYSKRSLAKINGIVIHHSASFGQTAIDYARYHISKDRPWPGIGYHFVIAPNGRIEQTNYLDTISYHTAGENVSKIGICLSGDFEKRKPTSANLTSLKKLVHYLRQQLPQYLGVSGHKDHGNTACPGRYLYPFIQELQLV